MEGLIHQNVIDFLLSFPELVGQVGDRITPSPLPQGYATFPAVTVDDVSDVGDMTTPEGRTGWRQIRVQVNSFAPTKYLAGLTDSLVRQAMQGWRGRWGSITVGSVSRLNSFSQYQNEVLTHMIISDFQVTVTASQ